MVEVTVVPKLNQGFFPKLGRNPSPVRQVGDYGGLFGYFFPQKE